MTTTPATTEIDTLKALLDSENSAPWDAEYCEPHEVWIVYNENADKVAECFDGATADLIAAARNALPALLGELAKLRDRLTEAEAAIVNAQVALTTDHPVFWVLDDYDGSMDSVQALKRERDATLGIATTTGS